MFGFGRGGMGLPQLDELNKTLLIGGVAAMLVARAFAYGSPARVALTLVSTAALLFGAVRLFSHDPAKTAGQNMRFLAMLTSVKQRFWELKDRLTRRAPQRPKKEKQSRGESKKAEQQTVPEYKYCSCPECARSLRVPKGKGRIRVTCPECGTKFETDS